MLWKRSGPGRAHRQFFDRLVEREIDALHRTAYRLCRDRGEAEDLTREVFIKAWKAIVDLHEQEHVRPWLFRVLRNAWIDRLRKHARRPQLLGLDVSPEEVAPEPLPMLTPVEDCEVWEEHLDREVIAAMDELPEAERQVLFYYTFGELTYQEIAEALESPIGTVMSRLHRARRRLQERLAQYAAEKGIIKGDDEEHAHA